MIFALIAVLVVMLLMVTIAVILGIDLIAFLLGYVLCFLVWIVIGVAVALIWDAVTGQDDPHLLAGVALGVALFALYYFVPYHFYPFSAKDVAIVAFYNNDTGKGEDVVTTPERVERLMEELDSLRLHRYIKPVVPSYLSSLVEKETVYYFGVYDSDQKKLAEINLVDGKLIGIAVPDKYKWKWYALYSLPDFSEIASIRGAEVRDKTTQRLKRDNGDLLTAFLDDVTYEDGDLVIPIPAFVYEKSLKLEVTDTTRRGMHPFAVQETDLIEDLQLKPSVRAGETVRVPIDPEKQHRNLTVRITLDGVSFSRDVVELLPEAMIFKSK